MSGEKWIFTCFLAAAAWQDLKERRVSAGLLAAGCAAGAALQVLRWLKIPWLPGFACQGAEGLPAALLLFVPGVILLFISRATKGGVGAGDGFFFLMAAFYLEGEEMALLLSGGLFFCSICSLAIMLWGKINGVDVRKKRLPFLTFLLPVWAVLIFMFSGKQQ